MKIFVIYLLSLRGVLAFLFPCIYREVNSSGVQKIPTLAVTASNKSAKMSPKFNITRPIAQQSKNPTSEAVTTNNSIEKFHSHTFDNSQTVPPKKIRIKVLPTERMILDLIINGFDK